MGINLLPSLMKYYIAILKIEKQMREIVRTVAENRKKGPDFGKKCPACVHSKCSFRNI